MRRLSSWTALACTVGIALSGVSAQALDRQVIAGAGPSTKVVQLFVQEFSGDPAAASYEFQVPAESTKHAGGIACSDKYLFGRTGRPLNEGERSKGKGEIFLGRIPIAFATGGGVGVKSISLQQLEQVMTGKIANWKELGGPDADIVVVGREPGEALFSVLKRDYPFFRDVSFERVFGKDDFVVFFLKSDKGEHGFGFGALPNFSGLNVLSVEGFASGAEIGLVYDLSNESHETVAAAREFAKSERWHKAVQTLGLLPPK